MNEYDPPTLAALNQHIRKNSAVPERWREEFQRPSNVIVSFANEETKPRDTKSGLEVEYLVSNTAFCIEYFPPFIAPHHIWVFPNNFVSPVFLNPSILYRLTRESFNVTGQTSVPSILKGQNLWSIWPEINWFQRNPQILVIIVCYIFFAEGLSTVFQ